LSMAQQKTVRSVAVWLGPSGALSLDALWRCITPALGTWCLAALASPALGHYCDWPPQRSAAPVLGALRQSTALALSCPSMSHRARRSPPINHPGAQSLPPSATRLPWRSHACNIFTYACIDYSCINAMMKSPSYSLIHSLTPPPMTDCFTA